MNTGDNGPKRRVQELHEQDRKAVHAGGKSAVVIRYPEFDPESRPDAMTLIDASPTLSRNLGRATDEFERYLLEFFAKYPDKIGEVVAWLAQSLVWANHLEQVREGLRKQLTRYERASIQDAQGGTDGAQG